MQKLLPPRVSIFQQLSMDSMQVPDGFVEVAMMWAQDVLSMVEQVCKDKFDPWFIPCL